MIVSDKPDAQLRPERHVSKLRRWRDDRVWSLLQGRHFLDKPFTINGYSMCVHSNDVGISKELALYRVHEPCVTELYRTLVHPGDVIVDIGSNIGYYALMAEQLVGARGLVLAIEPETSNYYLLLRNIELNNAANILPYNYAIGDKNGVATFYLAEKSNIHSMLDAYGSAKSTTVQSVTLKSLLDTAAIDKVNLIRMDVEGYETTIIPNILPLLAQWKPTLVLELHCDVVGYEALRQLLRSLASLGYKLHSVVDRDDDFKYYAKRHMTTFFLAESVEAWLPQLTQYRVVAVSLV